MTNLENTNYIITDSVFERVKHLIVKDTTHPEALRISVEGGGCSGFKYKYELTKEISEDDIIVERNGTKVVIDPMSAPFLKESKIDFVEDLGSAYFEIKNPNATSKCGCGSSFGV